MARRKSRWHTGKSTLPRTFGHSRASRSISTSGTSIYPQLVLMQKSDNVETIGNGKQLIHVCVLTDLIPHILGPSS